MRFARMRILLASIFESITNPPGSDSACWVAPTARDFVSQSPYLLLGGDLRTQPFAVIFSVAADKEGGKRRRHIAEHSEGVQR